MKSPFRVTRRPISGVWRSPSPSSSLRNAELSEVTFRSGAINSVQFSDVSFGGVVWNQGPDFTIGSSAFTRCRFYGGQFDRTTAIDTDFINCLFYGTEVELSGFGAVRFSSKQDNADSPVITDGTVTAFESAVITNCLEPPAPGVLDFGGSQNEVKFTNVVFESCRFRGFIRPEWFASCSFNRCIFPKALALAQIEKAGNSLTESSQLEENCP